MFLLFEVICVKFYLIQLKSSDFKAQINIYLSILHVINANCTKKIKNTQKHTI